MLIGSTFYKEKHFVETNRLYYNEISQLCKCLLIRHFQFWFIYFSLVKYFIFKKIHLFIWLNTCSFYTNCFR